MNKIRLQVALAKANVASRRAAVKIIEEGRVEVNGEILTKKGSRIDISKDKITVDGRRVQFSERKFYYILNKPKDVLSASGDPRGRKTVMDFVPKKEARLYPVGRLDKDTTGLIILTNDGEFTYRLTHPKFEMERVYEAKVKGLVKEKDLLRIKKGIFIEGKRARADKVIFKYKSNDFTGLEVVLHEGRKREVRRLLEAIGHPVLELKRIAYGPLKLGTLKVGEVRKLAEEELKKLKAI